jgi:hypothetical protein
MGIPTRTTFEKIQRQQITYASIIFGNEHLTHTDSATASDYLQATYKLDMNFSEYFIQPFTAIYLQFMLHSLSNQSCPTFVMVKMTFVCILTQ